VLYGYVLLAAESPADQLVLNDNPVRLIIPAEHMKAFLPGIKGPLIRA